MSKFKVGDKVRTSVKLADTFGRYGIDLDKHWEDSKTRTVLSIGGSDILASYELSDDAYRLYWPEYALISAEPRREFIVIRRSGAETIAELRHDREVIKSAKATCAPSDTFDLDTGAKIAFDRLIGREADQAMPRCKMARVDEYETHFRPSKEAAERSIFKIGDRVVDLLFAYGEGTVVGFERDIAHDWTWVKFDDLAGIKPRVDSNIKPAPPPAHRFKVGDRVVTSNSAGVVERIDVPDSDMPYHVKLDDGGYWWATERELSPAPESPKFYTGKVFAEKSDDAIFASRDGRVFEFVDGKCINSVQKDLMDYGAIFPTIDRIRKEYSSTTWHEVKSDV